MPKAITGSPLKLNFHQSLYKIDSSLFVESWSTPKITGYFLNIFDYIRIYPIRHDFFFLIHKF